MKTRHKYCEVCGSEFYDRQANSIGQKYCSPVCAGSATKARAVRSYPSKTETRRLYVEDGLTDREFGAQFGRSYQWALSVRKHHGIVGRAKGTWFKKPLAEQRDRARWSISLKREDVCRNCGQEALLHLHHAIPRSLCAATKYDLRNGVPLCTGCHLGWHRRIVVLYRDIFTEEEWAYLSAAQLSGQRIEAWLDDRYPERPAA